ncbi:D-amino acid dehydrogenase small subunit [Pirellulimonas nuda]|uniref:D-amino acid dehydrogenase small subunit n=1 Tax=Pirellulimonas nuda TaxID=2528009 RepID=A0A518DDG3_9BACT|nr:TIGR03364 family FAD-dependent oxidoreductase [Pirellulimonas nuda]QDU89524.1 D-amino acid dehydrogenase small subunit [Pirellulimonas nuda]
MGERVAVIGAGIVGVAHAWREAVRGASVTLFERGGRAEGASVRNFGMIWPIGQPAQRLETALLSRSLWSEFVGETGVWSGPSGSLHVATRRDEWRVLSEFAELAPRWGYACRLLSAERVRALCPAVRSEGLRGGLFSDTEMGVDPREALAVAPRWLAERHGVVFEPETTIVEVDLPRVRSSTGRRWEFDRVTVASGADFQTLYPDVFAAHRLGRCKLQMMRTAPQPAGWRMGPMIASGLTLRHYPTFEACPGLPALRQRIAAETPELDRYGIHVMAAQNGQGEVVLGDSHEYGAAIDPFDKEEITRLMLRELNALIDLPDWSLAARWHGVYAVQPSGDVQFVHQPAEGVAIVIATGGCGMTLSFGLAEQMAQRRDPASWAQYASAAHTR